MVSKKIEQTLTEFTPLTKKELAPLNEEGSKLSTRHRKKGAKIKKLTNLGIRLSLRLIPNLSYENLY